MTKLRGIIVSARKTSEKRQDEEGMLWEKCILEVELMGLSKRAKDEELLMKISGKRVSVTRWCALDWHCIPGTSIIVDFDEIKPLIEGK
ncbi:MAG: hypothetical protein QW341_05625 [Candidatus Bathyarchaeia archaeon]